MSWKRAVVAGILSVVYPGLGHVYLREWLRALAWFGLSILAAAAVLPPEFFEASRAGGFEAILAATRNLPRDAFYTLVAIRGMNVIDAVWLGIRSESAARPTDGPACPNCGRELDADLDFCHWCTTHLDGAVEESHADGGLL